MKGEKNTLQAGSGGKKISAILAWILAFVLVISLVIVPGLYMNTGVLERAKRTVGWTLITKRGINYVTDMREPAVALTFDDGPDPRYTPELLDLLDEYHAKATFFVVGENAEKHPELLREIVSRGHELGNHTYTHSDFSTMPYEQAKEEIARTQETIKRITGVTPVLFRSPRGQNSSGALRAIKESGLKHMGWSVCLESKHKTRTAGEMARYVAENASSGAIILTHDGRLERTKSVQAMRYLLPHLRDENRIRVLTLGQVMHLSDSPLYQLSVPDSSSAVNTK